MRTIALVTDYGRQDYYAGALHGVIASLAPEARVVDITHEIEPQNVRYGAFVLWQSWLWFPPGTIFVAVVDPGVGTSRRVVVGKYADRYVVAPDNGLITWVHHEQAAQALRSSEDARYFLPQVSSTFHGRDILAPLAAYLSLGVMPDAFGPGVSDPKLLSIPFRAEAASDRLRAQVIYVDRFGNLVTNIHGDQLTNERGEQRPARVVIGGADLGPVRGTFSEVAPGHPLAYIGSSQFVEIGINQGSAAGHFTHVAEVLVQFLT